MDNRIKLEEKNKSKWWGNWFGIFIILTLINVAFFGILNEIFPSTCSGFVFFCIDFKILGTIFFFLIVIPVALILFLVQHVFVHSEDIRSDNENKETLDSPKGTRDAAEVNIGKITKLIMIGIALSLIGIFFNIALLLEYFDHVGSPPYYFQTFFIFMPLIIVIFIGICFIFYKILKIKRNSLPKDLNILRWITLAILLIAIFAYIFTYIYPKIHYSKLKKELVNSSIIENTYISEAKEEEESIPEWARHSELGSFPIKYEDLADPPRKYGFLPYGVKENERNEYNPGWTFELNGGSGVYAVSDMRISKIYKSNIIIGGEILKEIKAAVHLNGEIYSVIYGPLRKNLNIREGDMVKAGSLIGDVGKLTDRTSSIFYFRFFPPNNSAGACPEKYFSDEIRPIMENVLVHSINKEAKKPYEAMCVEEAGAQMN